MSRFIDGRFYGLEDVTSWGGGDRQRGVRGSALGNATIKQRKYL